MDENIVTITEGKECCICFEKEIDEENICSTDCSHIFCKDCLNQWFDRGNRCCPLCRRSIQVYQNNNEKYRIIIRRATSNNTISTEAIRVLIRHNYNMKYIIFILCLLLFISYNYYVRLNILHTHLLYNYSSQTENMTKLQNELNQCVSIEGRTVYADIWDGINTLKRCLIPLSAYNRCFFV